MSGIHAGRLAARGLDLAVLARHPVHVRGRAAEVGDGAGEALASCRGSRSISRRIESSERLWMMRPSCSVIEQKRAAAEAAAHDRDRELDHLPGRDACVAVGTGAARARTAARRRASISAVVSGSGGGLSQTSRSPWRCTSARALPGFDLEMQHARGVRVEHRIVADLLERRQADHLRRARRLALTLR